jgi:hypothetical protein
MPSTQEPIHVGDVDENDTPRQQPQTQEQQQQQQQQQQQGPGVASAPGAGIVASRADSILAAAWQSHHRDSVRESTSQQQQQQQQPNASPAAATGGSLPSTSPTATAAAPTAVPAAPSAEVPRAISPSTAAAASQDPDVLRQFTTARIELNSVGATSSSQQSPTQQQQQQQPTQPPSQQPSSIISLQRSPTGDSKSASVDSSTDSSWFSRGGPLWRLAEDQAQHHQQEQQQQELQEQQQQQQQTVLEEQHYGVASSSSTGAATASAAGGHMDQQQHHDYFDWSNDPYYMSNMIENPDGYDDIMHQYHPDDSHYARQVKRNNRQRRQRQLEIAYRRRPRIIGTGPGARLAETIKERMQSRMADPNATPYAGAGARNKTNGTSSNNNNNINNDYAPPRPSAATSGASGTNSEGNAGGGPDSALPPGAAGGALYSPLEQQPDKMVRIGDNAEDEEEAFIVRNAGVYAQKRVRVVQLLIVGLVGLLLGWLGNFFVGTSCHFAELNVQVGQYGDDFSLHFGLWKYSPADSALSGYKYCYPYAGAHESEAPILARVANLLALFAGTYSLMVLWFYLITGRALRSCWRWAVIMAILAGVMQFLTLVFFLGHLCRIRSCQWGPAASLALVTSVAWVVLGWELHYQAPPLYYATTATGRGSLHLGSGAAAGGCTSHRDSRRGHLSTSGGGDGAVDDDYRQGTTAANNDKDVVLETETVVTLEMADFQGASQQYMGRAFGINSPPPPQCTSTTATTAHHPSSSSASMSHRRPSTLSPVT